MSTSCVLEVVYTPKSHKFKLMGAEALEKSDSSQYTSVSFAEIMQIAQMYNRGVFRDMVENNQMRKLIEVDHHEKSTDFISSTSKLPTPPHQTIQPVQPVQPVQTVQTVQPVQTTKPTKQAIVCSAEPSLDSDEEGSHTGKSTGLWQQYVKIVKSQHPELKHAQAVSLASKTYQGWKDTQL